MRTSGAENVLVVEDDDDMRFITSTMLRSLGYRATEAATGKDALARNANLKVLYMSGYSEDAIPREDRFIQKPFLKQDPARKMREALDN